MKLVEITHSILELKVNPGDYCIDMTIGNGWDTLHLSTLVGDEGRVFGFDVQRQAILNTEDKLSSSAKFNNVKIFNCCHSKFQELIPIRLKGRIQAITFNLGYLPGSDKTITTKADTTLATLSNACNWMNASGIVTIIGYRGHRGGETEVTTLLKWLSTSPYKSTVLSLIHI